MRVRWMTPMSINRHRVRRHRQRRQRARFYDRRGPTKPPNILGRASAAALCSCRPGRVNRRDNGRDIARGTRRHDRRIRSRRLSAADPLRARPPDRGRFWNRGHRGPSPSARQVAVFRGVVGEGEEESSSSSSAPPSPPSVPSSPPPRAPGREPSDSLGVVISASRISVFPRRFRRSSANKFHEYLQRYISEKREEEEEGGEGEGGGEG